MVLTNHQRNRIPNNIAGGDKKPGLYSNANSSSSYTNAIRTHTMTLSAFQVQQPWQRNVSPLAGLFFSSSSGVTR
jgi:hypothetical protein